MRPVTSKPTVAVVIPTVPGREAALDRCLEGVRRQTRPADEVVVIRGCSTVASALFRGFADTSSEWVAFIDDDAVPDPQWLASLDRHFIDDSVGAVGGRIVNYVDGRPIAAKYASGPIARVSCFGRMTSRLHDIPVNLIVEDVDFLPGANVCFRRIAMPPADPHLDQGMAPCWEFALCLSVRQRGWRVRFDSRAVVEHFPAPRPTHLDRADHARWSYEYSYVLTYAALRHLTWPRKLAFVSYFFLVGQRRSPGVLLSLGFLLSRASRALLAAAWIGKWRGLRAAVA